MGMKYLERFCYLGMILVSSFIFYMAGQEKGKQNTIKKFKSIEYTLHDKAREKSPLGLNLTTAFINFAENLGKTIDCVKEDTLNIKGPLNTKNIESSIEKQERERHERYNISVKN